MTRSHHHRLIYRMTMNQVSGKQTIWFVTCVRKKGKKKIVGNKDLEKSCMSFFFKGIKKNSFD